MQPRAKVLAYITNKNRLLVFSHPDFPEAGIQVPAGTQEPGETLEAAVMREACEETGLVGLKLIRYLGDRTYDMSPWGGYSLQQRHFFHLKIDGNIPNRWRHYETSGSQRDPILFELFWAKLPDRVPHLVAGQGEMLPTLLSNIAGDTILDCRF
ncbi:NUDIX domain-containing protein [Kovacikia minuta CCNUW1]|uniref:NUDIX hydrolase n=1 Tax=Kovacikia minuta TaxID=2931930 RepID=UPI001CCBCF54|nr:NUDIX domain-containing protein [Kovacikia minuta]UBF27714.1 NUDIX domain-containing protein [Kovacikia minuta CCNUW1]